MRPIRFSIKKSLPPLHHLLPLVVFAYVALSFLIHPQSPFQTLALGDPDDYMRLNEVINWLSGQSWYDLSHPRLSPGAHTVLHWSRLVDLPIALLMLPLIPSLGMTGAALAASLVVPMILLALLLSLLPFLAEPLVGKERADLTAVFALFAPMMLFNFTPGRVDHHGWQILIAGFGLLCLERITRSKAGWRFAVLAGISFAGGLWIGTEAMPWLMLFIACLAVGSAWQGGHALRNAAVFGAALPAAILCVVPLALPMEQWHSRALSWFSPVDVLFGALAGGMLIIGWALGRLTKNRLLRLGIMLALAIWTAVLFFQCVPEAQFGPFADFDVFNSSAALEHIGEATPLSAAFRIDIHNPLTFTRALMVFMRFLFVPLLALGAVASRLRNAKPKERMVWGFHGVFLLASILLTIFWQVRVGWFMQMFAIAPLTWLAFDVWKKIGRALKGRPRFWAEVCAFLVLGPLPVLLLPALASGSSLYPNLILFPAAHGEASACPLKQAAEYIASIPGGAHTILSGSNEGPELMFRTSGNVIAGNFNVPANKDVFEFFNARDEPTARAVLRKWRVDLILTCRSAPPFYAGLDHPRFGSNAFLRSGPDGNLHLVSSIDHPSMMERLVNGHPPRWLKPVVIPDAGSYLLFDVTQAKTEAP